MAVDFRLHASRHSRYPHRDDGGHDDDRATPSPILGGHVGVQSGPPAHMLPHACGQMHSPSLGKELAVRPKVDSNDALRKI